MGEERVPGAFARIDCKHCEEHAAVPHTLRPQLDQALRDEAEALQRAARLIASRASPREFAEVMRHVEELRARRIQIQHQIEERRHKGESGR
jgi:hypothetical protein